MEKIKKTELARRLAERVTLADDQTPEKALSIMLYWWKNERKFGQLYRHALEARDWLYITEVIDLSEYAGCNLT